MPAVPSLTDQMTTGRRAPNSCLHFRISEGGGGTCLASFTKLGRGALEEPSKEEETNMTVTGQARQKCQTTPASTPPDLGRRAGARADAAECRGSWSPATPPQAQEAGEEVTFQLGRLLVLKGMAAACPLACGTRGGARRSVSMGLLSLCLMLEPGGHRASVQGGRMAIKGAGRPSGL